jgi:hypothetical protein
MTELDAAPPDDLAIDPRAARPEPEDGAPPEPDAVDAVDASAEVLEAPEAPEAVERRLDFTAAEEASGADWQ